MTIEVDTTDGNPRRSLVIPLTCSPPRLPADTRITRLVDRIQPAGPWQWVYFAMVAVAIGAAPSLSTRAGLALGGAATLAASAWCLANLWRCREAHCLITGFGWALLFVFELTELAIGHSVIRGTESLVFVGILVIAICFEWGWQLRYHSNALTRHSATGRN